MADLLGIGSLALRNTQNALDTTGHNVANVNTEGYSRQRVDSSTVTPKFSFAGYIGQGVRTESIMRQYSTILGGQVVAGTSAHTQQEMLHELANRLDATLADPQSSLGPQLEGFFASLNDLANEPTSETARTAVLTRAGSLVDGFHRTDNELRRMADEVSGRIEGSVTEVNRLTQRIADLNQRIVAERNRANDNPPNDLLDKRDLAVKELASHVGVSTVTDERGLLTVMVGKGHTLVQGASANTLKTQPDQLDPQQLDITMVDDSGHQIRITDSLQGGQLSGALTFRDEVLDPARNRLGRTAVALGQTLNAQHNLGMDLNGQLGGDMFSLPAPEVKPNSANTGSIDVAVDEVGGLTQHSYQLEYKGGAWSMTRLSDGGNVALTPDGADLLADGMRITPGAPPANGDVYLIRPTRDAPADIELAINDPRKLAAAGSLTANVATNANGVPTNLGNAEVADVEVTGTTHLPLTGPSDINLTYDETANELNITGPAGVVSPIPYDPATDSGTPLDLFGDGEVMLTLAGTPADGDSFSLTNTQANSGDNGNALTLAAKQQTGIIDGGQTSLGSDYANLVGQVGSQSLTAKTAADTQQAVLKQSEKRLDEVAGVNLDEEAGNLLRYQQAYNAAAQVISTADDVFQSLLAAVR